MDTNKIDINQELNTENNTVNHIEFECPICQDFNRDTKTTSCNHTFCTGCLDMWLISNHTCPMCRTEIREPTRGTGNTSGLTFNHPVRELVAVFAQNYNVLRAMSGMGGLAYSS
jgi:hypothetical protein